VVVNDLGGSVDGQGDDLTPAEDVVSEIRSAGGQAVANHDDVASWSGAAALVAAAVEEFGDLDVLVNNAGILRDRTLVNMSEEEFDAVIRVHLKGHFCPMRHAAAYWREQAKSGQIIDRSVINTSSTYLGTSDCPITGRIFFVMGGSVQLFEPWSIIDRIDTAQGQRWAVADLKTKAAHFAEVPFELNHPMRG
jgi:hypothetical protein